MHRRTDDSKLLTSRRSKEALGSPRFARNAELPARRFKAPLARARRGAWGASAAISAWFCLPADDRLIAIASARRGRALQRRWEA
jgi:hypothetical protein